MRLAYQTNTWGGVVGHPAGVTSIKDLYYLANGSTEEAIADVARAGYEGVELFDGNIVEHGQSPAELRRMLDECGLRLIATYSGANFIFADILDEELWRIEHAAQLAAELGAEHLVVGGGAQTLRAPRDAEYERLGAALERVVSIGTRCGLTASFHPHLGTIVETTAQLERVLAHTSIRLCPDTGHVLLAGDDPADLIRRHGERISYIHLKDADPEAGSFQPLGAGAIDLPDVMQALQDISYDAWVTVELDAWPDPLEGAQVSRRALAAWLPYTAPRMA
jgi:inosose dehydratase